MRLFLFLPLCIFSLNAAADTSFDQDLIRLSPTQIESYGIATTPLQTATEALGPRYPAEVVVPNSQLRVISALQGGLVTTLMVAEGDHVSKDQVLARIQSPGLLELQRDLLQTLTQLNLARSTLNRDQQLLEEGIIPKRRYLETRSAWQALVTQQEQQEATLLFSGMSNKAITLLEKNRKLDSTLAILAPFDGVLLEQMVIPGQKLAAADPLFKVGQLSPLWLEIHVPVDVINSVSIGDKIVIPEMNIHGQIITIGRMVHAADQGTLARAIVKDNIDQLRPGQLVQAQFNKTSSEQQSYLVPRKSIIRLDQKTMIFTKVAQGFKAIEVNIIGNSLDNSKGLQVITSSKAINTAVVISGAVTLKAILIGAGGEG